MIITTNNDSLLDAREVEVAQGLGPRVRLTL